MQVVDSVEDSCSDAPKCSHPRVWSEGMNRWKCSNCSVRFVDPLVGRALGLGQWTPSADVSPIRVTIAPPPTPEVLGGHTMVMNPEADVQRRIAALEARLHDAHQQVTDLRQSLQHISDLVDMIRGHLVI